MRSLVFASLVTVLLVTGAANAANITVRAEGVLSEFFDPEGLLPFSEPPAGALFSFSIVYDDTTDSTPGPPPGIASYPGPFVSLQFGINGQNYGPLERERIVIVNDRADSGVFVDQWDAATQTVSPGTVGPRFEAISLSLFTTSPTAPVEVLDSTDLVPPLGLEAWENGFISYSIFEPDAQQTLATARAEITSLTVVPVPAAAWLFGSALAVLGWIRRR